MLDKGALEQTVAVRFKALKKLKTIEAIEG